MSQTKATDRRDLGAFIPSFLDDYGLDPYEFRVYSHLARRAGSGDCWEKVENIAKACKMNVKTARKALALLSLAGLIKQTARPGTTNLIGLERDSDWVDSSELDRLREQVAATPTKSGSTKSGSTRSGSTKSGSSTPTKSGSSPLPDQVPKGTTSKGIQLKEEDPESSPPLNASLQEPEPEVSDRAPTRTEPVNTSPAQQVITQEGDGSDPRKTFTKENIEAKEWSMHSAPWRLSVAEYRPSILEAVLNAMGKLAMTDTGQRNDTWILAHLQKLERHGRENGGQESIAARARLLQLWETAQKLEGRQNAALEPIPIALDFIPLPTPAPTPEDLAASAEARKKGAAAAQRRFVGATA